MNCFSWLSWNVRGCNNIKNRRNIRSHIISNNINFLCLQETKCTHWDLVKRNSIWEEDTHGWLIAPLVGTSRGLVISWDKQRYKHTGHTITDNWILFRGKTQHTNYPFICINIYAPQDTSDKTQIWEQVSNILHSIKDIAICLMGDFNRVTSTRDRINCSHSALDSGVFLDFIYNNDITNIATSSPHYTWFGPAGKKSKLDWIFANRIWLNKHN